MNRSKLSSFNLKWDPAVAASAFLETIVLREKVQEQRAMEDTPSRTQRDRMVEMDKAEFVAALAAGTSSTNIIQFGEVSTGLTLALAVAAKQLEGQVVLCDTLKGSTVVEKTLSMAESLGFGGFVRLASREELLNCSEQFQFALVASDIGLQDRNIDLMQIDGEGSLVLFANALDLKAVPSQLSCLGEDFLAKSVLLPIGRGLEVVQLKRNEQNKNPESNELSSPDSLLEVSAY